ncbi:F-box domain containing protein [Metarhizium anisopliae]
MDFPTSAHQSETQREEDEGCDGLANPLLQLIAPGVMLPLYEQGSYYPPLFNEPQPRNVERLIAVPVRPPDSYHVPEKHGSQVKACASNHTQSGNRKTGREPKISSGHAVTILDLPVEIIRLVFEEVDCLEDLICLGLASRSFWAVARPHLHAYYMSFLGQWSGEDVMHSPIKYLLRHPRLGGWEEEEEEEETDETCPVFPQIYNPVNEKQRVPSITKVSMRLYHACKIRDRSNDPAFTLAHSEIVCDGLTYFPENEPWILRDITTKKFIRSEAIAIKPEYIHGPFIDYLGFREVVLILARSPGRLSSGAQVSPRFDITTLARHNLDTQAAEWKDVSEEVTNLIASIWATTFGPEWRETYVRLKQRGLADIEHALLW